MESVSEKYIRRYCKTLCGYGLFLKYVLCKWALKLKEHTTSFYNASMSGVNGICWACCLLSVECLDLQM